jgi:hypothetical protein
MGAGMKSSWAAAALALLHVLLSVTVAAEELGIGAPASDIIAVDSVSGNFVDTLGRTRFFRGVNAVSKLPPFHPTLSGFDPVHSLSRIDAEALRSWGFNIVRLGVLWQGVMPEPGVVNASYLDAIDAVVSTLADAGVYTILDAHQDCLGRRFCGEGLPDWVILKTLRIAGVNASDPKQAFPKPFPWDLGGDHDGLPDLAKCQSHNFVDYYNTKVSLASWRALYSTRELWDDFAQHWQTVANRFAGQSSVLGYELLNECVRPPAHISSPQNIFHPCLFRHHVVPWSVRLLVLHRPWGTGSDEHDLLPLYRRLHESIRRVDSRKIIMFEPHVIRGQLGIATDLPKVRSPMHLSAPANHLNQRDERYGL